MHIWYIGKGVYTYFISTLSIFKTQSLLNVGSIHLLVPDMQKFVLSIHLVLFCVHVSIQKKIHVHVFPFYVKVLFYSSIDRYNICIMAYGQTGSGKTHTMLGSHKNEDYNPSRDPHRDEGVIPRAARELFR